MAWPCLSVGTAGLQHLRDVHGPRLRLIVPASLSNMKEVFAHSLCGDWIQPPKPMEPSGRPEISRAKPAILRQIIARLQTALALPSSMILWLFNQNTIWPKLFFCLVKVPFATHLYSCSWLKIITKSPEGQVSFRVKQTGFALRDRHDLGLKKHGFTHRQKFE